VVWVMVACGKGALRLCFCYVVLYSSLSTMLVFGEDAKGIVANNQEKGTLSSSGINE